MLREHFKSDHYLCTEGGCAQEQFTSAFRSELDLKAHRLDRHSGGLSKSETRLNRIVGIDVSFSNSRQHHDHGRNNHRQHHDGRRHVGGGGGGQRSVSPDPMFNDSASSTGPKVPDMSNDFPTLSGANENSSNSGGGAAAAAGTGNKNMANRLALSSGRNIQKSWATGVGGGSNLQDQDFPSLPGSQPLAAPTSTPQYRPSNLKTGAKSKKISNSVPGAMEFPSLPSSTNNVHAFGATSYRNPKGFTPAWTQPTSSNDSSATSGTSGAVNKNKNKRKNKNKAENVPGASSTPAADAAAKPNLKSAADLIFAATADISHNNDIAKINSVTKKMDVSCLIDEKNDQHLESSRENTSKIQSIVQTPQHVVQKVAHQKVPDMSNDFPSLSGGSKKKNSSNRSVQQPVSDNTNMAKWVATTTTPTTGTGNGPPPGFAQAKKPGKIGVFRGGGGNFKYIDPPDFRERNSKLLNMIISTFGGGKSLEFANFKKLSNQFKENQINSDRYVKDCSELLDDSKKMNQFMPELIALLPNIPQQKVS